MLKCFYASKIIDDSEKCVIRLGIIAGRVGARRQPRGLRNVADSGFIENTLLAVENLATTVKYRYAVELSARAGESDIGDGWDGDTGMPESKNPS